MDKMLQTMQNEPIEPAKHLIRYPLSENDILALQDKFLNNGVHYIKVQNIQTGRAIIQSFLETLSIHQDVACLTVSNVALENYITDIYQELLIGHYFKTSLDEFFIDRFYFDFIWIERTKKLLDIEWYIDFEKKLLNFNLDQHIPMIMLNYEE